MAQLRVNGVDHTVDVPDEMPLLWAVRDVLGLTGSKFGCGKGMCGACTMHLNGVPVRTCVMPVAAVAGQEVVTIEGLGPHPLKQAWVDHQVPQCGYCQSGQLMAAASLLANNPRPTDNDIATAMTNLCRCGTYDRIRRAIHQAAASMPRPEPAAPVEDVDGEDSPEESLPADGGSLDGPAPEPTGGMVR
jgi:isoquinoline 1-oxidoreductase alpha subunit